MAGAIDFVGCADFEFVVFVEAIDVGDGESGDAVDHAGEAEEDGIEPAAAAGSAGCCAEFAAEVVKVLGEAFIDGGEGAGANAGGVCFADADDGLDGGGGEACAGGGAAGGGVGGGYEGVGAKVDVEEGALGAFEEKVFAGFPGVVEGGDGVGDVWAKALEGGVGFLDDGIRCEGGEVKFCEDFVSFVDAFGDLCLGEGPIEQICHADSAAVDFICVGGADAPFGGADFLVAKRDFTSGVEFLVEGQDDVRAI